MRSLKLARARLDRYFREVARGEVARTRRGIQEWSGRATGALDAMRIILDRRPEHGTGQDLEQLGHSVKSTTTALNADRDKPDGKDGGRRPRVKSATRRTKTTQNVFQQIKRLGGDWHNVGGVLHQRRGGTRRSLCGAPLPIQAASLVSATRVCIACKAKHEQSKDWAEVQRQIRARKSEPARTKIVPGGAPGLGKRH
jgi:hypothetical protein